MAITCLQTLDPGGLLAYRTLTMPVDVVLDAWTARHGSTVVPIPRLVFEDGSADPLLNNMCVIVYRLCRRNPLTDMFEHCARAHRVYATNGFIYDCVFVRVDLVTQE